MRPVAPRVHPVHWYVLCFMRRQRGGAGCGRAALAAAGRLLHSLARTATCGPPRLPGPLARHVGGLRMGLGFAAASARQDGDLRPASPAPRPAARWFAHWPATSVTCALALALLRLSLSAGLCV